MSTNGTKFERYLEINSLVFSSHKTSTQTLVRSLQENGQVSSHGHILRHLGFGQGDMAPFLELYLERNERPLTIYTVFREPVERLMSSFFQHHGSDLIEFGHIESKEESILRTRSNEDLHEIFATDLRNKSLNGYCDSLQVLSDELGLALSDLSFEPENKFAVHTTATVRLVLLRFDLLLSSYDSILNTILSRPTSVVKDNMSSEKWYYNTYRLFKNTLQLPSEDIRALYADKDPLIRLFYPRHRDALELKMIDDYSPLRSQPR